MSPAATPAPHVPRSAKGFALLLLVALATVGIPPAGYAQAANPSSRSLEGSWRGGGSVSFASGTHEQARCRAHYRRAGMNKYTVSATCATASGRAAQTATLRQVGENRYSGNFYNSEYSISGVIYVVVRGTSQTVRLISDSGSAIFNLTR